MVVPLCAGIAPKTTGRTVAEPLRSLLLVVSGFYSDRRLARLNVTLTPSGSTHLSYDHRLPRNELVSRSSLRNSKRVGDGSFRFANLKISVDTKHLRKHRP